MRRSPGYTLVACIMLALGIGANIGMFTVMRSVLWRPLPYANAEQLVIVDSTWGGRARRLRAGRRAQGGGAWRPARECA